MRYTHDSFLPLGAFQPLGGRMRLHGGGGGDGGGNSSTTTTTQTQNVDRRQVVDNGAVGITSDGGLVTINSTPTDYGAIEAARQIAYSATDSARAIADESIAATLSAAAASASSADASSMRVAGAYSQASDLSKVIAGRSFDLAATSSDAGFKTINAALGFTKDVLQLAGKSADLASSGINNAYSTAQDTATGARFLMTAGLAIAGILLVLQLPKLKGA